MSVRHTHCLTEAAAALQLKVPWKLTVLHRKRKEPYHNDYYAALMLFEKAGEKIERSKG